MEELDKVLQALSVVERYEEYLFRKTWGRVLIVIGTVLPLGALVSMNAAIVAEVIGLDAGFISILANLMAVILCFGSVAYTFFGAWGTPKTRSEEEPTDTKHGPIIGIVWFVCFVLTGLAPESLTIVSLLWAAGASCLLTFMILRTVGSHGEVRILLYLSLSLFLSSIPLLLFLDTILLGYLALVAFSVCFILAGIAMNRMAAEMLKSPA
ncbi:MAG: hypothetical protein ACFFAZ_14275 [Promethearchaeota archaeon]